jgi:hypothetical protein
MGGDGGKQHGWVEAVQRAGGVVPLLRRVVGDEDDVEAALMRELGRTQIMVEAAEARPIRTRPCPRPPGRTSAVDGDA